MRAYVATLLLVAMILSSALLETTATAYSSFCSSKCGVRCAKAGLKKRCMKCCGNCCAACNCVPSGTYGNKAECPCYRDKLNSKGKPKCP